MELELNDCLLTMCECQKACGLRSRTTIYKHIRTDPRFPKPVYIGPRTIRFRRSEVLAYISTLETTPPNWKIDRG